MIDVCYGDEEKKGLRHFGRSTLITQLESRGLSFRHVDQPTPGIPCLLFASVDADALVKLSADARKSLVVIAEGETPAPEQAEATRDSLGLLGLVEPRAWRNWQRGLFVAWGLYGRSDVAELAGLVSRDTQGLQPADDRDALPVTLAQFLVAAQRAVPA